MMRPNNTLPTLHPMRFANTYINKYCHRLLYTSSHCLILLSSGFSIIRPQVDKEKKTSEEEVVINPKENDENSKEAPITPKKIEENKEKEEKEEKEVKEEKEKEQDDH